MSNKPMAYVAEIKDLTAIKDKDRIVSATFTTNNWSVIVQKDQFKVGEKVIYIETESILPMWSEFAFLEKRCYSVKRKGYVIKRMSMGGVSSEGICFPLSLLGSPNVITKSTGGLIAAHKYISEKISDNLHKLDIDYDLTDVLQIRRKEDDIPQWQPEKKSWLANKWSWFLWKVLKIKRTKMGFVPQEFPEYVMKTDETQIQSIPNVFELMKGKDVVVTMKMDGMSATYANTNSGIFTISSRNRTIYRNKIDKAKKQLNPDTMHKWRDNAHMYIACKYNIAKVMNSTVGMAIQGEICGPGIQKNRIGLNDYDFFVFNFWSMNNKQFMASQMLKQFCEKHNLKTVPIVEVRKFDWNNVKEIEDYAAMMQYGNDSPAEGVVIREFREGAINAEPPMTKMHGQNSLKVINPRFKLKTQDEDDGS